MVTNAIQRYEPSPLSNTIMCLDERNRKAESVIQDYSRKHAVMDVGIGVAGLLPGAAFPALGAAILAQAPIIYQPMARQLQAIYTVEPGSLRTNSAAAIVRQEWVHTGMLDIANEFGTEFMMQIASELATEVGLGVVGSLCVPVIGGAVGAALDYLIANMMTWRVGTMVSMYYQNNGGWLGSRHATFERAKALTGGLASSVGEVLKWKDSQKSVRVNLGEIRSRIPQISHAQLRALRPVIEMMRSAMSSQQIREALRSKGVPVDLVEKAISMYYDANDAAVSPHQPEP